MASEHKASAASTCLLLGISASWVGVAQLARAAEVRTEQLQHRSVVPLVTWANATAWIVLAAPYIARRARERQECESLCRIGAAEKLRELLATDAFQVHQPARFLFIALTTNFAYIGALHYLPASLNTAIFCSSPVFTLLLSSIWLPSNTGPAEGSESILRQVASALRTRRAVSVALSVVGVLLIAEPWRGSTEGEEPSKSSRLTGAGLSIFAALGTAVYQVYFKRTFGDRMRPEEVGLFLAYMGSLASLILGALLLLVLVRGAYALELSEVPWALVLSTAMSSALFNFLIKFGLSRETPVTTSLGTQIGIPLNLLLDVLVVHSPIHRLQAIGTLTMLASFTLWHQGEAAQPTSARQGDRLASRLLAADPPTES